MRKSPSCLLFFIRLFMHRCLLARLLASRVEKRKGKKVTMNLHPSLAFLSTLIYASIIYHRHRISKRQNHHLSLSPLDHDRYDRFYSSPYSDRDIVEAHSSILNLHAQPPHSGGRPRANVVEEAPLESGGQEVPLGRPLPSFGWTRQEMEGDGEAHELVACGSVGSWREGGGY